jgi:hypothetical protein
MVENNERWSLLECTLKLEVLEVNFDTTLGIYEVFLTFKIIRHTKYPVPSNK